MAACGAKTLTVCIAALCNDGRTVVCAADRMLTGGDTQFEHAEPKIKPLTNSIFVLTAGDSCAQSEIVQNLQYQIALKLEIDSDTWLTVSEVASMYVSLYNDVKNRAVTQRVLAPFGLTLDGFLARQHALDPGFVQNLSTEIVNAPGLGTATIVAGCDDYGGHIYTVYEGESQCQDDVGFASIGSGGSHAGSYFMVEGHARNADLAETVFRTYIAKRRSEIAPGVGLATDLYVIGPALGHHFEVGDHVYDIFSNAYIDWRKKERELADEIANKVKEDVQNHGEQQQGTQEHQGDDE